MYRYPQENRFPSRKYPRLKHYDYRSQNMYFITICTYRKICIFGFPGEVNARGKVVENAILQISEHFPGIRVDRYVIMPNHVHMILEITKQESDLFNAIGSFKASVTRKIHETEPIPEIWKRSFYEHIIRNQKSYQKISHYIETNPLKWAEDCFYQQ